MFLLSKYIKNHVNYPNKSNTRYRLTVSLRNGHGWKLNYLDWIDYSIAYIRSRSIYSFATKWKWLKREGDYNWTKTIRLIKPTCKIMVKTWFMRKTRILMTNKPCIWQIVAFQINLNNHKLHKFIMSFDWLNTF